MELAYQRTGTPGHQPLLILHGFLGMADNWRSQALRLAERYDVWAIDLRNHGRSPHSDEFDYPAMADDIAELCEANGLKNIVLLGHSMGGKVAMEHARAHHRNLHKLVVADMSPRAYPPHHDDVLAALNAVELSTIQTRAEAETAMAVHLPDLSMRQFLLKSLARTPEGRFEWKFNLPVLTRLYANIVAGIAPYAAPIATPTLFIRGGNSHYVDTDGLALAQQMFSNFQLHTLQGVGHWVHAEAPDAFFEALWQFVTT